MTSDAGSPTRAILGEAAAAELTAAPAMIVLSAPTAEMNANAKRL
ncbi:hypothetical protein [Streptomyces monashensis]|nr:hypothetical protein [Streptomyces monashensis]